MILLIEPNKKIRKRLCDLLSRERILAIGSYAETLEMIAKFKNRINIIITNIRLCKDILLRGTLFRLCQKLYIEIPPILIFYRRGDEKIKEEFEKNNLSCSIIKFDGEDTSFPERYIMAIKDLYPKVIVDINKATEMWLKGEEPEILIDHRKWLEEEGFLEEVENLKIGKLTRDIEQIIPLMRKMLSEEKKKPQEKRQTKKQEVDYKRMYFELKQRHDELLKYVKELVDSSK
ncbi:MAG: hypothetical protein WBB37_08065 [bacterium]